MPKAALKETIEYMPVDSILRNSAEILKKKKRNGKRTSAPSVRLPLLETIDSPKDLRGLPVEKLPGVAEEIRQLLLTEVSKHGGHLAPSLGAVELTIALHYAYNTPEDKLVWDVGHQAYAHKIITGRREQFGSLRQYGGISGFPRISESPFDAVSVGHASTSISSALGMAIARDLKKDPHDVVAVIGDGALSGGLALEGLNNLGCYSTKMTVVLNDNKMSISRNVGALSRYLTRLLTDRRFNKLKTDIWELLGNLSNVGIGIRNLVHNIDDALKHFVIPGKLFEDMGLRYFGPVDGHNVAEMIEVFRFVKDSVAEPALIHVLTTKGKGYRFAENDATKYHGIGKFSLSTGTVAAKPSSTPTYSQVFGSTLVELAQKREDIVAITAAMPDGTGLSAFREKFPRRFFDVGIAESHAVTFASGLALKGMKPVVALYSTFLQRAYDQILHDVALDGLPVVFCIDRAGLVGDDGPTHHGVFDISFLRTVPGATIFAPRNEAELRNMLYTAMYDIDGPSFIRYPRGKGTGVELSEAFESVPLGVPEILKKGSTCAIVSVGNACEPAMQVAEELANDGLRPTVVNARSVKPLDETIYKKIFSSHDFVVTLEYNTVTGGFGTSLSELLSRLQLPKPPSILHLGLPDQFVEHGSIDILLRNTGLDTESIRKSISAFCRRSR